MTTEKFIFEIAAETKQLRSELKKSKTELDKLKGKTDSTTGGFKKFTAGATKVAGGLAIIGTAAAAAATAVTAFAVSQGRAIRETEVMATIAGLTTEEFRKMSFVMGTAGISGEKYGDIMKDVQERIGDFTSAATGPFQDFADVMGYSKDQALELAREFENLSGQEVMQEMVNKMQAAGKSTQEMSFAFEGLASNSTRLLPLLMDNGKAAKELGDKYDEINIELTEEEKKQFKDLATNVDLATTSFTNMLQNAVAPLIPKMNELFESFTGFFKESATKAKLFRLYGDAELVKDIENIGQIDDLEKRLIQDRIELVNKYNAGNVTPEFLEKRLEELAVVEDMLAAQREILAIKKMLAGVEADNKPKEDEPEDKGTGADEIKLEEKLQADLEARREAQKSSLKLLADEKAERLKTLEGMFDDENKLTADKLKEKNDLKAQIEADYSERAREIAKTDEEAKLEAITKEQKELEEIFNSKLISQEEYQAKLREIIGEYAPETLDPDLLEEKNQLELEMLNDKLANQLISYEDYFQKLGALQKKDTDDKKGKAKLENFWSDSSTKKQLDQGTQLLTSLGNNSKTAHKIKQGLAVANAGMNTAEGITKAMAEQDYVGASLTAAIGAAQIAAILSSKPDGGGSVVAPASAPQEAPQDNYNEQSATVTDISGGGMSSQRMVIEFSDESIDVIARKLDESKQNGRV